ncbi:NACHT domain-containing protein [Streptomyces profundus]|uniref:NACHT domain-containing protein n=1 Tax=Streptomyces profundus TaxID=2867410 RepID=UPI001D1608B9|nr:NACHT domain-containing protein [Streptomyces sp. MA3_2.13]UED85049.1 NACHT domain-containing protein [Streptomyces sp. MA3_2.13]
MDPMVAGMAGRLAGGVVSKSFKSLTGASTADQAEGVRREFPEWSEEVDYRGGWPLYDPITAEIVTILTQDQVSQVSDFMESPEVSTLTQFLLIAKFGCRIESAFASIVEDFEAAFSSLVENFCDDRNYNWRGLASILWQVLLDSLESVFPAEELSAFITADEQKRLSSYVGATQLIEGRARPANVAFRDLVEIAGDRSRFEAARFALHDIRSASAEFYSEVSLTHTLSHMQESFRFERGLLYVNRNLREYNSSESVTDDFLVRPISRPRCVVIGNPGVGKSTIVQHVVHKLSSVQSENGRDFAPLVIQCKEFAGADSSHFILDSLTRSLREDLQLDIDSRTVNDILTLGRSFIVFDGVDEIIDIARRQSFVRAVELFAVRYPLSPVLVTARRIGYQRAPLKPTEFKLYELDDFSDEQVNEYVEKWFRATERSALERDAFLRESQSIPDVRVNPLMLSLLCALYRARGYIPRNRREVYRSCADLLFQRWDSMRQIEQPMDHRHYGTRLMQDLAYFFYRSQSAQGGVEEGQLRKVISLFLTDTGSVEDNEAFRRSQAFLDFCADRAWLLTTQGTTDRGERIFGFTHRTFMEYFSAEEIVRRASSIEKLVDEVVGAYERDASSVLADVIVQCVDEKYDRGAEAIVAGLLEKARSLGRVNAKRYVSLSLRILNAAPLPKRTTDAIFATLFSFWERTPLNDTEESSTDLFDLYRDPRNRLHALLSGGLTQGDSAAARAVVARWARFWLSGKARYFDEAWAPQMVELAERLYEMGGVTDKPTQAYMLHNGILDISAVRQRNRPGWLTHIEAFDSFCLGPLSVQLLASVWPGSSIYPYEPLPEGLVWLEGDDLGKWVMRNGADFSQVLGDISAFLPELTREQMAHVKSDITAHHLLVWVSCVLVETTYPSLHPFHEIIDGVHGLDWFRRVIATREKSAALDVWKGKPLSRSELSSQIASLGLPTWFGKWCRGTVDFTHAEE